MGMLDDAIREHLELKRRSGAPDDEVRRLETEAFGERGAPAQEAAPEVVEPAPEAAAAAPEPDVVIPEPEPPAEAPWLADEDAVPADEEDADPEDLLEETPDFLQETPEHDRLWFEQKPPRDFDFDE